VRNSLDSRPYTRQSQKIGSTAEKGSSFDEIV